MLDKRIPGAANKQAGFTLIELMIAVVLGLLITAAVTAMTVNNLKMSGDTLKSARLNHDLGAVMQIMVNDIRRAGYEGGVSYADNEDINIVSSSCILYSYNRADDDPDSPKIDDNERNGFKLDQDDGAIKMRTECDPVEDDCSASCLDTAGTWVPLTDPEIINITGFELSSENSKCHNIDEKISARIKLGESATKFACTETTSENLEQWGVDGTGNPAWVGLSVTPIPIKAYEDEDDDESNDDITSVGVRHVNISLEAELTNDSSVSKNLGVSIKVRNDHVYIEPEA